jgi:hypothetical protein
MATISYSLALRSNARADRARRRGRRDRSRARAKERVDDDVAAVGEIEKGADACDVHHKHEAAEIHARSNGVLGLTSVGTAVCLSQLNARPVAAQSSTRVDDRKGRRTGD